MTVYLDEDLDNADWTKRTWDLDIDNIDDLKAYLKRNNTSITSFKLLPVYKMNVDKIPWLKEL